MKNAVVTKKDLVEVVDGLKTWVDQRFERSEAKTANQFLEMQGQIGEMQGEMMAMEGRLGRRIDLLAEKVTDMETNHETRIRNLERERS